MRIHGVDKIAPQPLGAHEAVNGKILTALQIRTRARQARARRARHDGGRHLVVHSRPSTPSFSAAASRN